MFAGIIRNELFQQRDVQLKGVDAAPQTSEQVYNVIRLDADFPEAVTLPSRNILP